MLLIVLSGCGGDGPTPPPPPPEGLRGIYTLTHFDDVALPKTVIVEDDTADVLDGTIEFTNDSTAYLARVIDYRGLVGIFVAERVARYQRRGDQVILSHYPPPQPMLSADTGALTATTLTVREKYLLNDGTVVRTHVATYSAP